MDEETEIAFELQQQENYRFAVNFAQPRVAPLLVDEGPPLGGGAGPEPSQLLGAAVGHCLSSSLLFALRKFHNEPAGLRAAVRVRHGRNEHKRLRVAGLAVDLHVGLEAAQIAMRERILGQFEDFCVVTQSVRGAVPVRVRVLDRSGAVLHESA